jgi:hypothetical protein
VLVAVIGLIGTVAASGLVTELFKRRNLRESIRTDLEVYEKLPDGPHRDDLLADIQTRVSYLLDKSPNPALRVGVTTAAVYHAALWAVLIIGGNIRFERDHAGVLRIYGLPGSNEHGSVTFPFFIALIAILFCLTVGRNVLGFKWGYNRSRARRLAAEVATSSSAAQDESPPDHESPQP